MSGCCSEAGRLFQILGPTTEKLLSPSRVFVLGTVVWRCGSLLVSINKVNQHRVWLVLRWVTGFSSQCRTLVSVCDQQPLPTQPSIFLGSVNEDQLRLGRKRRVWFIPLADEHRVCR